MATESLLKMRENAFCLTLKALFALMIFQFLFYLWVMYKNGLIRKIRLISKRIPSQPKKKAIAIHILPNISRSKGQQTLKFGQLIEYNMRNIFIEKHTQNVVEKLFRDPFLKNHNWAYLWINRLKFYTVCFYFMPSCGLSKCIGNELQTICFYVI